jgi:hypothetical protein
MGWPVQKEAVNQINKSAIKHDYNISDFNLKWQTLVSWWLLCSTALKIYPMSDFYKILRRLWLYPSKWGKVWTTVSLPSAVSLVTEAAVGKGDHKRLQALFKDINMYAEYVPWSADSLNLAGNKMPPQYLKLLTTSLFSNNCLCSFGFRLVDGIF